jgi:hypothetical protein
MRPAKVILPRHTKTLRGALEGRTGSGPLSVCVPYTTDELTRTALSAAAAFANSLQAKIILLDVHIVPFPLPLNRPDVSWDHLKRVITAVAEESPLPVEVKMLFARDKEIVSRYMPADSIAVVATKNRWWRTGEEKLAGFLSKAGYSVALLKV